SSRNQKNRFSSHRLSLRVCRLYSRSDFAIRSSISFEMRLSWSGLLSDSDTFSEATSDPIVDSAESQLTGQHFDH
nr:hypothetical protein [Tanacetum cinerariifolium]